MHSIDQFRHGILRFNEPGKSSLQLTTEFAEWLLNDGIALFEAAYKEETTQTIPRLPDGHLIEQAYPKSLNEVEKKHAQQAFYSANARIFVTSCTAIAEGVSRASQHPFVEPFARRHHDLLKKLVLDAQTLLADWAALHLGVGNMYGIGKNPLHSSFEISHATDQLIYAGSPYFAFADNATDSGTALLRVALETRLRFGFGLLGILDKESRAVLPLNLSTVIAAVKAKEAGIIILVPLKHIERLYGWSNIYVHIGLKHYTWSPIFASQYLGPLLRGGIHSKGSSSYAGIQIDEATLKQVQQEAANLYELDGSRFELLTLDPENCHVVLR